MKSNHTSLKLADGHVITVSLETVTPELATRWLKSNVKNRKPRPRQVEILRREMAAGAWQFTHQGVAFGEPGEDGAEPLLDGQHRLMGIVASGATLENILVFRNLPRTVQEATDMGQARSVAENLQIFDGITNATQTCGMVNAIATGWARYDAKVSLPQTREILRLFPQIPTVVRHTDSERKANRPAPFLLKPVIACCCVALHKWPSEAAAFHDSYQKGTRLDETHPAWHLRNHCFDYINQGAGTGSARLALFEYAADCLQFHITGEPMVSPKPTGTGTKWLRQSMASKYNQLRDILRLV